MFAPICLAGLEIRLYGHVLGSCVWLPSFPHLAVGLLISIHTDVSPVAEPWVGRIPSVHTDRGQMQPRVPLAEVVILQREWEGGIRLALPHRSTVSGSHRETMSACVCNCQDL